MRNFSQIKAIARFQFKRQESKAIGAGLIFLICTETISFIYVAVKTIIQGEDLLNYGLLHIPFTTDMRWVPVLIIWGALIFFIITLPMAVGYAQLSSRIYIGQTVKVGDVLEAGFANYLRSLGGMLWMLLFIMLWSLLLIVPGIIKSYSYFAMPYILAEYPNVRIKDALKLSVLMTKGFKSEIWVMQLTFIGWFWLNTLTFGLLGILYVNPYYYTSMAGMYVELRDNAILSGRLRYEQLIGVSAR